MLPLDWINSSSILCSTITSSVLLLVGCSALGCEALLEKGKKLDKPYESYSGAMLDDSIGVKVIKICSQKYVVFMRIEGRVETVLNFLSYPQMKSGERILIPCNEERHDLEKSRVAVAVDKGDKLFFRSKILWDFNRKTFEVVRSKKIVRCLKEYHE